MHYVLVFIGGGIGALARHGVNRAAFAMLGPDVPLGTVFVNVLGSMLMGLLAGLFATRGFGVGTRLFLATGVLGGFTTFSAFSLDAVALWQRGEILGFAAYVIASVALSILGLSLGMAAARLLA
ncbi:MAG: fluoride efflux transporter CrcB [Sphingomonadaceae bacterium]|nr:fluoride efflux transporter CrcB [Sphingomonadaceae bacterium]